jgi:branched-chain amino acid transport system substrate-binding protein
MNNVKFFGGDGICTDKIIELSGGAKTLAGVTCAEGGASLAKMPGGTAWRARYDAKYPKQFQVYSPYTYDAVHVLVDAMVRAGSADPKVYTVKLFDANYQGVTAKIGFEADGELKNPAMTLYNYKDGKKIPLN